MKQSLREWLSEGPFTLALSSSFFGFFAHAGFADALYQAGRIPQKFTGSSAGALVAAALASGHAPDQVRELVFGVKRNDFWDPGIGLGYLRGQKLLRHIEPHVAKDFSELKAPLGISVFDVMSMRTRYLTEGPVAKAVVASCAVPLMFHPVRIGGRIYVDGGINNKSGIHPGDERVLCVYLESAGVAGAYERKTSFPDLKPSHKIVRFTEFPRANHNKLEVGPRAYQDIFARATKAFDLPFRGNFLDV